MRAKAEGESDALEFVKGGRGVGARVETRGTTGGGVPAFGRVQGVGVVAGGVGRRKRKDALQFENLKLHAIGTDEFAVEAWLRQEL